MRVLLVARTAGPMKNLARVAQVLTDRNHEVVSVLSKDAESMVNVHALMGFNPDVILITTSSANISDELAVIARARECGIPYAVFSDTYGAYNRPMMSVEMRKDCAMVFVPDVFEVRFAEEAGYSNVVVSGVPLWEDFADLSNFSDRDETRNNLGLSDNEDKDIAFIWAPGKNGELNKAVFRQVFQALSKLSFRDAMVLLPRFHPGDPNLKNNPHYYDDLMAECPVRILDSSKYNKTDDLVPALDLVISSASTVGITAIYQRNRVIEFLPPEWVDHLEKEMGRRVWPPAECGAAVKAESVYDLTRALTDFFHPSPYCQAHNEIRSAQEVYYPIKKGGAAKRIVDCLEQILARRKAAKTSA